MGGPTRSAGRTLLARAVVVVILGMASVVSVLAVAAAPAGAITGIDVASYQHPGGAPIDWRQVRNAGHSFAYVKATEATSYTNPYFAGDWAGAGSVGLYRGAYHYAKPALPLSTAVAQARYFVSRTGSMGGALDLPPMFDLEETGGLSPADLTAWSLTWLREVEALTGRRPVIYTGYYFWLNQLGGTNALSGYRLWLPQYTSKPAPSLVPSAWGTWTFWQYSSTGSVPGIVGNVDMNHFCCVLANLAAMAGSTGGAAVGNPFGSFDGAWMTPGAVHVSGWAIDPDTTGAVSVHVYVDGKWRASVPANKARADVGAAFPGWGSSHGYNATIPVGPGSHQVCAYAINTGSGTSNPSLGCRTVVPNPVGSVDRVFSPSSGVLSVGGWAADPDTTAPIDVHLYVDGVWTRATTANQARPDVQAVHPGAGPAHGYQFAVGAIPGGSHRACVYAINVGPGTTNPLLGCRTVNVLDGVPTGNVDSVVAGFGSVTVSGWALDPDTPSPIDVQVLVDGTVRATATATLARPDVGQVYPTYGESHGYRIVLDGVAGGRRRVCVRALNVLGGTGNPTIGCRDVNVPADPVGNLDSVSAPDGVRLTGWAIDPDRTGPIAVHVYVDGRWAGQGAADVPRPDVGAVFPAYGPNHGFDVTVAPAPDGVHTACVYAINIGPGANSLLGCESFTVKHNPFGSLDAVARTSGQVVVSGWAIDPNQVTSATSIHVYVGGAWGGAFSADLARPDVAAVYPAAGANHGFQAALPVGPGPKQVCVYAINLGPGTSSPLLGCRTV